MAILHQTNHTLRNESWNEILDITQRIRQLTVGGTTKPIYIDSKILPDLPSTNDCITKMASRTRQPLPAASTRNFQTRVNQLRERVLLNYTTSISQMTSSSESTELQDSDMQRQYSRSLESWFSQAIEELYTAHLKQPEQLVRIWSSTCLSISSTDFANIERTPSAERSDSRSRSPPTSL